MSARRVVDDGQDGQDDDHGRQDGAAAVAELGVLACPVSRTAERAAARAGDLLEAPVVITQGAHPPLAGLLLVLPALQMTGLLEVAERTFPPMRKGFYGLRAILLMAVFMALLCGLCQLHLHCVAVMPQMPGDRADRPTLVTECCCLHGVLPCEHCGGLLRALE